MSEQEEPAINVHRVLLYEFTRKQCIRDLESATFKAETWNRLEDQEKQLRENLRAAANHLQELVRLLGQEPPKTPAPTNVT